MSTPSLNITKPARDSSLGEIWRGALAGLVPLGLLVGVIVVSLILTVLARQWLAASGFFVQQQAELIVLLSGLAVTIVLYAIAILRTLRRIKVWQRDKFFIRARSALWALGVTALIVALPVLLAIILPQHPAS